MGKEVDSFRCSARTRGPSPSTRLRSRKKSTDSPPNGRAKESRSIDRYAKFYDRSFQGKKGSRYLDYNAWMDDMASKFRSASHISVGLSDLDIQQTGDRFTVEYKQTYKASNYSDVGYKKLTLIRDANDNLKIVGESWRGL